jgi:hypothetical protein
LTTVWYGRTACGESAAAQLRRQHHDCTRLVTHRQPYTACYFDIGVGYRPGSPARRLDPHTVAAIGLPYAGGMAQLLHDAANPSQPFDRVVCFDLARVSRRAQVVGDVIDHLVTAQVDLLVPPMAGLLTVEGAAAQRFAATFALMVLQPDHAHRAGHLSAQPIAGEGRR